MQDRRKYQRIPVLVECRVDGASRRAAMRLTDLSLGGCYVDTIVPLPEGAEVTLNVTLGEIEVALTGRVVHMQPDRGFGFAIAFSDLNDPVRQQLAAFLRGFEPQS